MGCCFTTVSAGSVGVVQLCGDFQGYVDPGCVCFCYPIQTVFSVSLALKQIQCSTECKTKDNVTLSVTTTVLYRVDKAMIKEAMFDIMQPERQIGAYVDDVLRSTFPALDLDDAYSAKDKVCTSILESVRKSMQPVGYFIEKVLITDLSPEKSVLAAMNAINASKRQRQAAEEQGEAQKVLQVKAAEADAEAKRLSGVGVARMRKAVAEGFKESMQAMAHGGLSAHEAMHMLNTTQYLDTIKEFAANEHSSSIMVPCGPAAMKEIEQQVKAGFVGAQQARTAAPGQVQMLQPPTVYASRA